ncbi:hypothetical protein VTJ49DRAFT_3617 [Mycothermus thermophilus]|uniref:Zn(2)-C6 fungal-type domain-containing protein n=1 Tax=Humicola insolens TaxID=85995 RepID=A0ABR3V743_HUMIN
MPQARPPKRPSDAGDGAVDGAPPPKVKVTRLERGPEDFSSVVKTKLQSYTRTGQACDRCKVRKIRCDALPEGCSHCTTQNLDCYVTDRVTGRTERRGYLQQLEREKGAMLVHIRELEKLLETQGVEVRPWQWPGYTTTYPSGTGFDQMGNPVADPSAKDQWHQVGLLWVKNTGPKAAHNSAAGTYHNTSLATRPKDSFLGVAADNAPLSSIKGTTLSILGATIDITSFEGLDMDEPPPGAPVGSPLYNKSVMALLQSVCNINPPLENVELPAKKDALTYAEWYFLMVSPFLPILHKPSFLQLLTRIYDDPGFEPSVPELVIVHMVFATIYFQYGVRNREQPDKFAQLNELSNKHYHWCLSKFCDLASSQTVTAVQAMAMIVSHTRSFPKPGCSVAFASVAFTKAVEMNLHRAVKIPGGGTTLENEVRKRVWWAILGILSTLNGRLGRPMPITLEEFDVEFPVAINDEYIGEKGILDPSKIGYCNYIVGLMGFKATPLFMEMYSKIYSVRRDPSKYVEVVTQLEQAHRNLVDELPDELHPDKCQPVNQVFALYTQAFLLEFTLCLRHPSVCMTKDPKFCAENTRICEETARRLLDIVRTLLQKKSLDTTWYQLAVYVGAVFTTLVAHWQRRFTMTPADLNSLRDDMFQWLGIIGEIGGLMGTGHRIASEVGTIIERTLNWIEQDMRRKPPSPTSHQPSPPYPAATGNPRQPTDSPLVPSSATTAVSEPRNAGATNGNPAYYGPAAGAGARAASYPPLAYSDQQQQQQQQQQHQQQHPQQQQQQQPPPQQQPVGPGLTPNGNGGNDSAEYLYAAATAATAAAANANASPLDQTAAVAAQNPLIAFASQAAQHVAGQQATATAAAAAAAAAAVAVADPWQGAQHQHAHQAQILPSHGPGPTPNPAAAWQDWTNAIQDTTHAQDRYGANTLLALNTTRQPGDAGTVGSGSSPGAAGAGAGAGGEHMASAQQQQQQQQGDSNGMGNTAVAAAAVQAVGPTGQWPLLLFDGSAGGHNTAHAIFFMTCPSPTVLLGRGLRLLFPIAFALTLYVYFYPLFRSCAFPLPSSTDPSIADTPRAAFLETAKLHLRAAADASAIPNLTSTLFPGSNRTLAPFRLLALGDPQLEGSSSIPTDRLGVFPHLQSLYRHATFQTPHRTLRQRVRAVLHDWVDAWLVDAFDFAESWRKRMDLWGNDYYLAHVYRTMRWWARPTHVTVLGDLLGSQWIDEAEFERRAGRFWGRVFKGAERLPDGLMAAPAEEYDIAGFLGEGVVQEGGEGVDTEYVTTTSAAAWERRLINVAGNHDIGYAGDLTLERAARFERAFGKLNYELRFELPVNESLIEQGSDRIPPEIRIIVLNDMNLDTPAITPSLQDDTYAFVNAVIRTASSVNLRGHFTLVLTHIPLYKPVGVCVDDPFFSFHAHDGSLREQNQLSEAASRGFLEGILGMSGSQAAPGKGRGRRGIILNGHDHEGCDTWHYINQTAASQAEQGSEKTGPQWQVRRYRQAKSAKLPRQDGVPGVREVTVRSMMGEYGGNAGLLSLWFDEDAWEWRVEYAACSLGNVILFPPEAHITER